MKGLSIGLLCMLSITAFGKKINGTIIRGANKEEVVFNVKVSMIGGEPNFERIQYKVKYFTKDGTKKVLRPDDADEILFEYGGIRVRMISCINNLGLGDIFYSGTKIFLKLEIDGPLRLYRYYYQQSTPAMTNATGGFTPGHAYTVEILIFQKGKGPLTQPRRLSWRKDMREYFSDCPALQEQLENKELRRRDLEAITMFYNKNCVQK